MERYNLHMLGLSEVRWPGHGEKRLQSGYTMYYSGREDNRKEEGVAIVLSKGYRRFCRGVEYHNERIISASFSTSNKNINLNLVQIYAPQNGLPTEQKEEFYRKLQEVVDKLPQKDVNIIMGDANAKIGADNSGFEVVMGKHGMGEMNENGEFFANFCNFNNLVIGGSIFPHKDIHKVTWESNDGQTMNQIDHFCISRRFRGSLQDVRAIRGADVGSDHHLLLAKFRLKLKRYKSVNTMKRRKYHVGNLQKATKEEFTIVLRNKFDALQTLYTEDSDIDTRWNGIKDAFLTSCQDVLGEKKSENKVWISQKSLDLINERRKKKEVVNASRSRAQKEHAKEDFRNKAREVKRSIKEDRENYINGLADKAEKAAANGHMRVLYQITKTLSGKYSKPQVTVTDKEGQVIYGEEAQADRWKEHFSELLNRPAPVNPPNILPARTDLPIGIEPPSAKEIEDSIRKLNSGKAAGPDEIPPEALKANAGLSAEMLQPLFEKMWKEGQFPKEWKEGHLIKLPKKGDLSQCGNYRGITLLSIPGKVFARILLDRIKEAVDRRMREEQAGFRKGRSTRDQIATLRIILEQSNEWNSPLLVNFIDYEKAFDSVDRDTLWKILRHYGVPIHIVNLIREMYQGTNCRVIHDGQLGESFDVKTGVRQGCLLSPFLFILALDWLMKETTGGRRNGIQWTLWTQLDDLDYADDIALMSHTKEQMQAKTTELDSLSKSVGLRIHPGKTKLLRTATTNEEPIELEGNNLEDVDSFCYLGSILDKRGGTEADIKARISKAQISFKSLNNIWKAKEISVKTKLRIFNSNVKSVLMYGCETWATTKSCTKRLQTFINKCLRRLLRIRWTDRIRNEEVWERAQHVPVDKEIGRRRWKWIGHTLRKPESNIARKALDWNPQGKRHRGRPKESWRRVMDRDLTRTGKTWNEVKLLARDRLKWREFVGGLYPGAG